MLCIPWVLRLAIDDSVLATPSRQLAKLPFDTIKVDRSLVGASRNNAQFSALS